MVDLFNGMKIDELKVFFLRLRGLKVSGKKAVLVARPFSTYEFNVEEELSMAVN